MRFSKPISYSKIRLLLVDDHTILRQGLARLLTQEPDIEIVGEAPDGETAVKLAFQLRPDVVLMDVVMPKMNGVDATRAIRGSLPEVRVIGLSMYEAMESADAMLNAGAVMYLTKTLPVQQLIAAIRSCAKPRMVKATRASSQPNPV